MSLSFPTSGVATLLNGLRCAQPERGCYLRFKWECLLTTHCGRLNDDGKCGVRCFYVLVHGKLEWPTKLGASRSEDKEKLAGFYCHRFVLASSEKEATERAFRRVRDNLDRQTGWLAEGTVTLSLEAEEITAAPIHKLLNPDNRGHTFYGRD